MGKCESASASLGIKILLSELVSQIDETNINLIKYMLELGFIEDENEIFNDELIAIINSDNFNSIKNHLDFKEYLTNEFKQNCFQHGIARGTLINEALLIPIKKILDTTRWGYDRCGTNGLSRPINFDLSVDVEKYKDIKNFDIVFILNLDSG